MLDEADVRSFLKLRSRAQPLFPGLFLEIRELALAQLVDTGAYGVIGEFDRERAMALFPELGLDVPVDWVAFGFPGREFYDVHVGVILETSEWPVLCHTGLHVSDGAWPDLEAHVTGIDWRAGVGSTPESVVAGEVREHRFCDPATDFDFGGSEAQAVRLAERAVAYYRAAFKAVT